MKLSEKWGLMEKYWPQDKKKKPGMELKRCKFSKMTWNCGEMLLTVKLLKTHWTEFKLPKKCKMKLITNNWGKTLKNILNCWLHWVELRWNINYNGIKKNRNLKFFYCQWCNVKLIVFLAKI